MAAASENQGLKIAVASFVTLTVILAVTTYFGFSQASENAAKQADAEKKASEASRTASEAVRNLEEFQRSAGYPNIQDFAALKSAVQKDQQELEQQLTLMDQKVGQLLQEYRAGGGDNQTVDQLANAVKQTIAQIVSEPNRTFKSTQQRMTELVDNMSQLTTALTLDNKDLHAAIRAVDEVNAQQLQVATEALQQTKEDLENEHAQHEQERMNLVMQVGDLQTLANQQQNEITRLETTLASTNEQAARQRDNLLAQLRGWREQVEAKEEIMDVPDGKILFVDHNLNEVRTTLGRRQGARERMLFSVFDRNSPGLPTDRPKGKIELIRVNENDSIARIVETKTLSDPIRLNDLVYSAAWSADRPRRFALVGKIDMDQDGRDDREDLKRLIRQAGGQIDYDLPPPEVGQESGEITGLTTFYVLDNRDPLRPPANRAGDFPGTETSEWLARKSAALEKAQQNGVRPIALDRLLAFMGYTYGQAASMGGRVEAVNRDAINNLLNRSGRPAVRPEDTQDAEILTAPPGGF